MESFRRLNLRDLTSREDLVPGTYIPDLKNMELIDSLFRRVLRFYYGYSPSMPFPFHLTTLEFKKFESPLRQGTLKLHELPRMGVLPKGLRFLIPRNSAPVGLRCGGHEVLILHPNISNVPAGEVPKDLDPDSILTAQLRGCLRYFVQGTERETWGGKVFTFFTNDPKGDESKKLYIAATDGLSQSRLVMNRKAVYTRVGAQISEKERRLLLEKAAKLLKLEESERRGKIQEGSAVTHPFRGGLPGSGH